MSKPKRIIALVHEDGRITTEHEWHIGMLADLVDYEGLEKEAIALREQDDGCDTERRNTAAQNN